MAEQDDPRQEQDNLQTFLTELALDPKKFAAFLEDPERTMRDRRLNDEDREALLSGIPAMIWARLVAYMQFPPPYYTPIIEASFPRPTYVTMPPLVASPDEIPPTRVYYVTRVPIYVTLPPPLYIPGMPGPHFVTSPPRQPGPDEPPEDPPSSSPRTRAGRKK